MESKEEAMVSVEVHMKKVQVLMLNIVRRRARHVKCLVLCGGEPAILDAWYCAVENLPFQKPGAQCGGEPASQTSPWYVGELYRR